MTLCCYRLLVERGESGGLLLSHPLISYKAEGFTEGGLLADELCEALHEGS